MSDTRVRRVMWSFLSGKAVDLPLCVYISDDINIWRLPDTRVRRVIMSPPLASHRTACLPVVATSGWRAVLVLGRSLRLAGRE